MLLPNVMICVYSHAITDITDMASNIKIWPLFLANMSGSMAIQCMSDLLK